MANQYLGTPLESDWERLQRKRAINQALLQQSLAPYKGTERIGSGRFNFAVDNRLGEGVSKIGNALMARYGNKEADEELAQLNKQYSEGREAAIQRATEALTPQPENYVERNPAMKPPDKMKAAMAFQDPYLKNDDITRALINSQAYGGGSQRGYITDVPDEDGYLWNHNKRTGEFTPIMRPDGTQAKDPRFTPGSQYNLKGAGEAAVQQQKSRYEPARAEETERRKIYGKTAGEAEVEYPKTEEEYSKSVDLIDELVNHPGFKDAVGFPDNPITLGGLIPWTDAFAFRKRLDQLTGRGFMQVFPTLKGGGQITEIEGEKAQKSINRMSAATNEKEFLDAAQDFKEELFRLKKVVAERAGADPGSPPTKSLPQGWSESDESRLRELEAKINAAQP